MNPILPSPASSSVPPGAHMKEPPAVGLSHPAFSQPERLERCFVHVPCASSGGPALETELKLCSYRPMRVRHAAVLFFVLALLRPLAFGGSPVVINEIMYHPPDDQPGVEYIELFNTSSQDQDLSGWSFGHGVKFTFPDKTHISPAGYLVVCRDTAVFKRVYGNGISAIGNFEGRLNHHGDKIELLDKAKKVVESLKYSDERPWPLGADGYSSSLERICPASPAGDPHSWASSKPANSKGPGGSPGRPNAVYSAKPSPIISDVRWESFAAPGKPLSVSATIKSETDLEKVVLQYKLLKTQNNAATAELPMQRISGDARAGQYQASIPAAGEGSLVRFTISAFDKAQASRIEPPPTEPRPAFSAYFTTATERAKIPIVTVLNTTQIQGGFQKFGAPAPNRPGTGNSAFVYIPPDGKPELFDFVRVRRRAGGWKVHFLKDQMLDEMNAINVIFEGSSRWVLSEHLAYELYNRAGLKAEKSGHFRLTMDGRPMGYFLFVEQPNKNFLARTGRNDKGNLYKILWYHQGDTVAQHEKKTNPFSGHRDVVNLIRALDSKTGQEQWDFIDQQFNVEEMANYFAVNMCIQNWDGFFNNYFTIHDTRPGGKWEIIPWDEDKTWGDFDGASSRYDWYEMPLTMGMNSDRPSGRHSGGYNFGGWWRPPGPFSGPLLANPQFRKRFEARLKQICETVFTDEKFGPVVESLRQRLEPEVRLKAQLSGQDPADAAREFAGHIDSFHRQLVNRRKYILAQLTK